MISLAPGVSVVGGALEDVTTGRRYPLTGVGPEALELFVGGESVAEVTAEIAERYGVSVETVRNDIADFLDQLDRQALISTRQSYGANVMAFLRSLAAAASSPMDLLTLDASTLAQPAHRYPARPLFVILGCIEAQSLLYAASLAVIAAAVAFKVAAAWRQKASLLDVAVYSAARPTLALCIFALLFMCHETGHLVAVQALGLRARSVAVRMWAVGITYARGTPSQMLIVAAAGPIAALTFALGLAAIVSTHPVPALGIGRLEVSYIILFGLLHVWSLRPWAQDGRQAANALLSLSRRREKAADFPRGLV